MIMNRPFWIAMQITTTWSLVIVPVIILFYALTGFLTSYELGMAYLSVADDQTTVIIMSGASIYIVVVGLMPMIMSDGYGNFQFMQQRNSLTRFALSHIVSALCTSTRWSLSPPNELSIWHQRCVSNTALTYTGRQHTTGSLIAAKFWAHHFPVFLRLEKQVYHLLFPTNASGYEMNCQNT